jgi:phosphate/sulfate permease
MRVLPRALNVTSYAMFQGFKKEARKAWVDATSHGAPPLSASGLRISPLLSSNLQILGQMATIRNLLMAWVLTLPAAICLSAGLYVLFSHLF